MQLINRFLDSIKDFVKRGAGRVARLLNKISGGKVSPDMVTYVSLMGHVLIAGLIVTRHPVWAGVALIVFGLMDTLDGELARLQHQAGPRGMLLDSVTDRMKEVLLYIGISYFFVDTEHAYAAVWAVAATGGSLLVSYVNAWGEVVVASGHLPSFKVNQNFRSGLLRYEVRMALLVFGLFSGWLLQIVGIIAVLAWFTAYDRLSNIRRKLRDVQA